MTTCIDYTQLAADIKRWGNELGFQQVGIAATDLSEDEAHLLTWLGENRHGTMRYMAAHGLKRSRPEQLTPGTVRIISARMDYWPDSAARPDVVLSRDALGYVSRYALGRDYHKVLRKRLQRLGERIEEVTGRFGFRAFCDSAPVLEKAIARNAGLGWIGKHTNLINRDAGSWFFIGELYTDLPLPVDSRASEHCGSCHACIDACPTGAITAAYRLDARLCISYLTIEHRGSIPEELRPAMGNRIYGCDDCQLVCPWNRFASPTAEQDFEPRQRLDTATLISLFSWTRAQFLDHTAGTAIRRIGYECWLRNIAVALGNAHRPDRGVVEALLERSDHPSALVREHVQWALQRHGSSAQSAPPSSTRPLENQPQ